MGSMWAAASVLSAFSLLGFGTPSASPPPLPQTRQPALTDNCTRTPVPLDCVIGTWSLESVNGQALPWFADAPVNHEQWTALTLVFTHGEIDGKLLWKEFTSGVLVDQGQDRFTGYWFTSPRLTVNLADDPPLTGEIGADGKMKLVSGGDGSTYIYQRQSGISYWADIQYASSQARFHHTGSYEQCSYQSSEDDSQRPFPLFYYLRDSYLATYQFGQGIGSLRLTFADGQWRPMTHATSLPSGDGTIRTTLSADGLLVTTLTSNGVGNGVSVNISRKEEIDLKSGHLTQVSKTTVTYDGTYCTTSVSTESFDGTVPIVFSAAPSLSELWATNPFGQGLFQASLPSSVTEQQAEDAWRTDALAADGEAALPIFFRSESGDPVTLTVQTSTESGPVGFLSQYHTDYLRNSEASGTNTLTLSPSHCIVKANGCTFAALFWAPPTLPSTAAERAGGPVQEKPVTIVATQNGVEVARMEVMLVPTPVVLVHGLWSNYLAWDNFENWLTSKYPAITNRAGYPGSKPFTDPIVQKAFRDQVLLTLIDAARAGIAARRVDVVGHSMGGLVARYFIQTLGANRPAFLSDRPIRRLVTIGTPHLGSPIADVLFDNRDNVLSSLNPIALFLCRGVPSCTLGSAMASMGRLVDGGAVASLRVSQTQAALPTPLLDSAGAYRAIAGAAPVLGSTTGAILNTLTLLSASQPLATIFREPHDTIVPLSSQRAGALKSATIGDVVHAAVVIPGLGADTDELTSTAIVDQARSWLLEPQTKPASSAVSITEVSRDATVAADPLPILDLTGYTEVAASNVTLTPTTGTALTVGVPITIAATSSTKSIQQLLLLQNVVEPSDAALLSSTSAPFSIQFTSTRLGAVDFQALVAFTDGTFATMPLHYTFDVNGPLLALQLVSSQVSSLPIGSSGLVKVRAAYATGVVDVTKVATFRARSGGSDVFALEGDGVVTGIQGGADWVDVSYAGMSASAPINVGSCRYRLSIRNRILDQGGGTAVIHVDTTDACRWTASFRNAWVALGDPTGTGAGQFTVEAAPNTTGGDRQAIISVGDAQVTLVQPATSCSYSADTAQISVPAGGLAGEIRIATSCPILPSIDVDWASIVATDGGIVYTVAANTQPVGRSGTITVGSSSIAIQQAPLLPRVSVSTGVLRFAATTNGAAFTSQTPGEILRLTQSGAGSVTWSAVPDQPWITVSPASGSGTGTVTIGVTSVSGSAPALLTGSVTFLVTGAENTLAPIAVALDLIPAAGSTAPFGSFDTPADGTTGVAGSVAVTGWALDDVGVDRVTICRDGVAGESPAFDLRCDGPRVYIGDALIVEGMRPDVQAFRPTLPQNSRAGWGYLMLTNFLPGGGNGTFTLHAYAKDVDGHSTELGTRAITVDNQHAVAPFGAIDTPAQGEVVCGASYINFGWALTQAPKDVFADSSTITVFIDGVPVGHPGVRAARADISALFSGYDTSHPVGGFFLDTTAFANGVHTIFWIVTDSDGKTDGIGSRFFSISNPCGSNLSTNLRAAASRLATLPADSRVPDANALDREVSAAPADLSSIMARRGFDLTAPLIRYTTSGGRATLHSEELDRIELHVGGGAGITGYLHTPSGLVPLPIGSNFDTAQGVFTWMPAAGFIGSYDLVFVRWSGGRAAARQDVRIVLNPKGSNRVGTQTVIDIPSERSNGPGPILVGSSFFLAGWAVDLDAQEGTGVDAIHVWAYPVNEAGERLTPVFVGTGTYGGRRPDVAAFYGDRFAESGYGLVVQGLSPGTYDIAVFTHSTVQSDFAPAKIVRVVVR